MTTLTLVSTSRLTTFERAVATLQAITERRLEYNATVAHLLRLLCDQWPDLELSISDSPSWSLYAGCNKDEQLWELGRCDGFDVEPVQYLAPAYLNGYRFGRNSALSHQELRFMAFRGHKWTERDSSAMEY